jgi:hypothetical protein
MEENMSGKNTSTFTPEQREKFISLFRSQEEARQFLFGLKGSTALAESLGLVAKDAEPVAQEPVTPVAESAPVVEETAVQKDTSPATEGDTDVLEIDEAALEQMVAKAVSATLETQLPSLIAIALKAASESQADALNAVNAEHEKSVSETKGLLASTQEAITLLTQEVSIIKEAMEARRKQFDSEQVASDARMKHLEELLKGLTEVAPRDYHNPMTTQANVDPILTSVIKQFAENVSAPHTPTVAGGNFNSTIDKLINPQLHQQ